MCLWEPGSQAERLPGNREAGGDGSDSEQLHLVPGAERRLLGPAEQEPVPRLSPGECATGWGGEVMTNDPLVLSKKSQLF